MCVQDILNDIETRFTVKSLKTICSACNLPVGGTKPLLQQRLRGHFLQMSSKSNYAAFNIAKSAAEHERGYAYGTGAPARTVNRSGRQEIFVLMRRPQPGVSTASPSSTTGSWGMSSLYQNVRNRTARIAVKLM
jgi:SAP domain